jgi:hypothetical protein
MAANKLIVKGTDGTTDKFVVDDRGFIGIGNNTPAATLDIVGGFLSNSGIRTHFVGTNANGGGSVYLLHNNGTNTAMTLPVTNDRVGAFNFGSMVGTLGTPTSIPIGAEVVARAEANWSGTSAPTYLRFGTTASGAILPQEKMRITSTGNVGIGASAPAAKLDVAGGIRLNSTGTQPTCSAANAGTLWLNQTANPNVLQICAGAGGTPIWRTISIP